MIPENAKANFRTILEAADAGRLALVETTDAKTGAPRYVIVAVSDVDGNDDAVDLVPFGHLSGNAYEEYDRPQVEDIADLNFVAAHRDNEVSENA